MARSVIMNLVISALVVWAVIVLLWMTILSINWNTINCKDSRERLQRTININGVPIPPPYARTGHPNASTNASGDSPTEAPQISSTYTKRLLYYSSQIDRRVLEVRGNCTLVVQTYKRADILPKFLSHYCRMVVLKRILVVWNAVDETFSGLQGWVDRCGSGKKLKFIKSSENKITNRYIPRKEIETDCVFLVDDDQLTSVYDMEFGTEVWQNFRHLVVGFEESGFVKDSQGKYTFTRHQRQRYIGATHQHQPKHKIEIRNGTKILRVGDKIYNLGKAPASLRAHSVAPAQGDNSMQPEGYSIMKTPCFVHKAYLEMYFDPLMVPASAVEYVDGIRNCEDILLSIMVTKFLQDSNKPQSGVFAVKPSLSIKSLEEEAVLKGGKQDLSKRPGYFKERSKCLHRFSELYGYLPLQSSNTIATLI